MMDDERALEKFNSSVYYKEGGYFVTWPWKPYCNLSENFDITYGRMKSYLEGFKITAPYFSNIVMLLSHSSIVE